MRKLIVMLDADDCFYNNNMRILLLCIAHYFSQSISSGLTVHDIEQIQEYIAKFNFTDHSHIRSALNAVIDSFDPNDDDHVRMAEIVIGKTFATLEHIDSELMDMILCAANEPLTNYLTAKIKSEQVTHVVFMVGSNRQSNYLDAENAQRNHTRSFLVDLKKYAEGLQAYFVADSCGAVSCEVDLFLLANIFSPDTKDHALFDVSKFILLYAFMHYVALRHDEDYQSGCLAVEFFDDKNTEILKPLFDFFNTKSHANLLPANLPLTMIHYEGWSIEDKHKMKTCGMGKPNERYAEDIEAFVRRCGLDLDRADTYLKMVNLLQMISDDNLAFELMTVIDKVRQLSIFAPTARGSKQASDEAQLSLKPKI